MKFLKHIKLEIRNILKSKFILVIGIIVLAVSLVGPGVSLYAKLRGNKPNQFGLYPMAREIVYSKDAIAYSGYYGGGDNGQGPITVDGVTITMENPVYWNIRGDMQEQAAVQGDKNRFTTPEATDLYVALLDEEIHYYAKFAKSVTKMEDYRAQLIWQGLDSLYDKFIIDHNTVSADVLQEVVSNRKGLDPTMFKKKYVDITADERQALYIKADQTLSELIAVVENNDFPKFIELSIQQQNTQIDNLNDNIAVQQQAIIDNPSQEDILNNTIDQLRRQIKQIQENEIPILEFRLKNHIVPGEKIWQNNAISDMQMNRSDLVYNDSYIIVSDEVFNNDIGRKQQYGTYGNYVSKTQAKINEINNKILIAQRSLDAGKPDMKYVADGARNQTAEFLFFSSIVALFAALLGGWLMASEYQQGTIRLLMIRPKSRSKILFSKYAAALAISLAIYAAGSLINAIANGAVAGFADFGFPNYTISGEVGFLAFYLPKFLACIATILLGFTSAFMLSVVTKNTAVAIAAPIVCFVGSLIFMSMFAWSRFMGIIAYTPMPYVQISSFFTQNTYVQWAAQQGVQLSWAVSLAMLLALSAVCTFVAGFIFKKRDITN